MKESIFAVKLEVQKKYWNITLKIALKLMVNKGLRCLGKVNKTIRGKQNQNSWFMQILKVL